MPLVPPYTTSPVPTTSRPYYPSAPQPPSQTNSIVHTGDSSATPQKGLFEYCLDALKERGPELGANAAATRANFSELGRLFWTAMHAPLSFAVTIAASAISVLTRGQGPIGANATRIAVGAGHATVAELSRPKQPPSAPPAPGDAAVVSPADSAPTTA